jgi:hypothetical protein
MTQPEGQTPLSEGQTARDIFPEDEGQPEVQQDDFPTIQANEDPNFAPLPGDRPGASADFGTTAFEQSEGEPLSGRLDREIPDGVPDIRPAAAHALQLEQDLDTSPPTDSGTERTADDIEATIDPPGPGGEGPEEGAVHITEG